MDYYAPNVQDRTREFQQCVSTFEKQSGKSRYKPDASAAQREPATKSEFSKNAAAIAKDIARVTGSLARLAQLAKRKQLFNDRPTDIIELTYVIKQDIFRIEKSLKSLQQQSGRGDSQIQSYNKNVVQLLNTKTKNISETFKEVLQVRQRNELAQRSRQEQLMASVKTGDDSGRSSMEGRASSTQSDSLGGVVPYALRNKRGGRALDDSKAQTSGSDNPFLAALSSGAEGTSDPGVSDLSGFNKDAILSLPDQSRQLMLLEEQDSRYLQERSNAVETIEATINEVGGLFQQLATMVQEQGEVIQRIDNNVEDVSLNITGAQRQLIKYYNNISSNRWLMVRIFGILLLFFLLWVLVS